MRDIANPIPDVSARDILKGIIRADDRFQQIPTKDSADQIAAALYQTRGIFIRTDYLLEVWQESFTE